MIDVTGVPMFANVGPAGCPKCQSINNVVIDDETRRCRDCGQLFRTWLNSDRRPQMEPIAE